jgi:hypothetical protein
MHGHLSSLMLSIFWPDKFWILYIMLYTLFFTAALRLLLASISKGII